MLLSFGVVVVVVVAGPSARASEMEEVESLGAFSKQSTARRHGFLHTQAKG